MNTLITAIATAILLAFALCVIACQYAEMSARHERRQMERALRLMRSEPEHGRVVGHITPHDQREHSRKVGA